MAARFAAPFGAERAAAFAGLLHDLGKYTSAFQFLLDGDKAKVSRPSPQETSNSAPCGGCGSSYLLERIEKYVCNLKGEHLHSLHAAELKALTLTPFMAAQNGVRAHVAVAGILAAGRKAD